MNGLRRDFRIAVAFAWLIVSGILFTTALVPLVIPAETLFRAAPVCEAKKRGSSCVLCGMTTAYVAIGRADFDAARLANAGALPLWSASLLNFPAFLAYILIAVRKRR